MKLIATGDLHYGLYPLFLRHKKVTHLLCGHSHNQGHFANGSIACLKVGSSYRRNRYEVLELQ